MLATSLAMLPGLWALAAAQPCNPSQQACLDPVPGFKDPLYVDFTKTNFLPSDWILADYASVSFLSDKGAQFTFNKRYDAPYIWTNNYFMFGRVDVEVQAAPGIGLITGCVVMSDNKDELDWEWSGNNFGQNKGLVQTNYFGKGITGNYDRGTQETVDDPTSQFHTYSYDWRPEQVDWLIDGKIVRTLKNDGKSDGDYQYPQTPSRLHLGIWNAGDPDSPLGVVNWAGGYLNLTDRPYSAYIKSVKITPYHPCSSYRYSEKFSGNYQDVDCTNQSVTNSTISRGNTYSDLNTTSAANQTAALDGVIRYTVKSGDDCSKISQSMGCTLDQLKSANPSINCEMLLPGQTLTSPQIASTSKSTMSSSSNTAPLSSFSAGVSTTAPNTIITTTVTNVMTVTAIVSSGSSFLCAPTATVTVTTGGSICSNSGSLFSTVTVTTATATVTATCPGGTNSVSAASISLPGQKAFDITASSIMVPSTSSAQLAVGTTTKSSESTQLTTSQSTLSNAPTTVTTTNGQGSTIIVTTTPPTISATVTTVGTLTTVSTITMTSSCTVCNPFTNGGTVTTSCSQSMSTIISTTTLTTTIPITSTIVSTPTTGSSSTISTASTAVIQLTTSSNASGTTQVAPQNISSENPSSSISIPSTPFLTTVVVPCTSCVAGVTTVTSTCSTATSMSTVTVPCSSCPSGSTTSILTSIVTFNYTTGPPLPLLTSSNSSTKSDVTSPPTPPSCTPPMTTCSTGITSTTSCDSGKVTSCSIIPITTSVCGGTICVLPTTVTSTTSCSSPMTTCSTTMTTGTSCEAGQTTSCATTSGLSATCGRTICIPPYINSSSSTSFSTSYSCQSPGTTCSTAVTTGTSCAAGQSISCSTVTGTSTTCASSICVTLTPSTTSASTTNTATSTTSTSTASTTTSTTSTLVSTSQSSCTYPGTTCTVSTTSSTSCSAGQSSSCPIVVSSSTVCASTICITSSTSSTRTESTTTSTSTTSNTIGTTSTPSTSSTSSTSSNSNTGGTTTTPSSTSSTPPTTSTVPPFCTPDACFNNMWSEDHIDDAHNYAYGFCNDKTKPMPPWLTACTNKASATSAFQCITASATPVPSADSNGKRCYEFKGSKKWGKMGAQSHKRGRREYDQLFDGDQQINDGWSGQGPNSKANGWKWFGIGN